MQGDAQLLDELGLALARVESVHARRIGQRPRHAVLGVVIALDEEGRDARRGRACRVRGRRTGRSRRRASRRRKRRRRRAGISRRCRWSRRSAARPPRGRRRRSVAATRASLAPSAASGLSICRSAAWMNWNRMRATIGAPRARRKGCARFTLRARGCYISHSGAGKRARRGGMSNFFAVAARLVAARRASSSRSSCSTPSTTATPRSVVACLGLSYCFTFVISRRWQYYGLNAVSLFGMTVSWVDSEPRSGDAQPAQPADEARLCRVSIVFAALVELLCAYRLLTSLLGHGWSGRRAPAAHPRHSAGAGVARHALGLALPRRQERLHAEAREFVGAFVHFFARVALHPAPCDLVALRRFVERRQDPRS